MSDTVMLTVANPGYDFNGCDSRHSDNCACATWEPAMCPLCEKRIEAGQDIYVVIREMYPYLAEDDEDQNWETIEWHKSCDPGTPAADNAERHRCRKTRASDCYCGWRAEFGDANWDDHTPLRGFTKTRTT